MLEPVPPAPHTIASWDDALGAVRASSTDLKILLDDIERANGQWRVALAASLPTLTAGTSCAGRRLCACREADRAPPSPF